MPLSIVKLENLLASRNMVCNSYFVLEGECTYIEVLSYDSSEIFFLYIPSKYKFKIPTTINRNVFKLKFIDLEGDLNNVVDDNIESPDHKQIEKSYKEINLDMSPDANHRKLTNQLEEQYNRPILLKDIYKTEGDHLKEIYRQLKRIRFCVQNIKYKTVIITRNYLCCISRDDNIMFFLIKNYPKTVYKRIIVTTDLEVLYEKMDSILNNVLTVRKGIYNVLNRNQVVHSQRLDKLLDQRKEIQTNVYNIQKKLKKYSYHVDYIEKMLATITSSEQKYIDEINILNNKFIRNSQEDVERSEKLLKYSTDLNYIANIKQNVVSLLIEVRSAQEDLILSIDRIMFDNQIMVHHIFKNNNELVRISQK